MLHRIEYRTKQNATFLLQFLNLHLLFVFLLKLFFQMLSTQYILQRKISVLLFKSHEVKKDPNKKALYFTMRQNLS